MALAMFLLAVSFAFSFSTAALATAPSGDSNDLFGGNSLRADLENNSGLPSNVKDPRMVASRVIQVALGFLGIIAVIIILYAGFTWMIAGGNEEKVGEAKKMLTAGLIGLVIILSAYALASFVIDQIYNATN